MKYKLRADLPHEGLNCIEDLLKIRGVEDVDAYIRPNNSFELSPFLLDHVQEGVNLLLGHLEKNSEILFIVDSDCDGVCSSAILWKYCKKIFPDSKLDFVFHEGKEHGIGDHIDWLVDSVFDLIIIPDAGSTDEEEYKRLLKVKKDVLCIDHHECEKYIELPNLVMINNQLSINYSNKDICGAGVVYKFCQVMDMALGIDYSKEFLDLVALANIGDIMDIRNLETRYYIFTGLKKIKNEGLKALLEKQKKETDVTALKISFYIVPLINAIIRVASQEEKEILFLAFINPFHKIPLVKKGGNPQDEETVLERFLRVATNAKNKQKKLQEAAINTLEVKIHKEGLLENKILLIEMDDDDDVYPTLTGLVAGYFSTKYQRPVILGRVNKEGFLRGSARGNASFDLRNLKQFLTESQLTEYNEGHSNAFGFSIHTKQIDKFLKYVNETLPEDAFSEIFYIVDYIFSSKEYFFHIGSSIASNEKLWANSVVPPTIIVEDIALDRSDLQLVGADKKTAKFKRNGIEYIIFKAEDFIEAIRQNSFKKLTVYGEFGFNEWGGRKTLQILINDWELK